MTTEDDFHKALDANPGDWQTRLVFADWLEERGDPRAEGYRALGARGLRPRPDTQQFNVGRRFFTWFQRERQENKRYHPNSLPRDWFQLLEGGEQLSDDGQKLDREQDRKISGDWLDYPTRREAEDAAARAFAELPPARRAALLAPADGPG